MKLRPIVAALALLSAAPAFAQNTLIDFETAPSFASIGSTYAGLGVVFGADAQGLANDELGPYFSNAPSPLGVMFAAGSDAAMNAATGIYFTDAVSFSYSSSSALTGAVQVWSGLNGTGTLLASIDLANNAASNGCIDSAYCNFGTASASFAGTAQSVTFGGAANAAVFDNVAITAVPEPAAYVFMALGLGGLIARRRRV
jgi:hypothetical protein